MIEKNYAGLDGFIWWMGIVESRQDPLKLGRCRVRIFGWHSESVVDIPSEDLPWAHPVNSLNANSFTTPKESDLVFGFFADGRNAQIPVMLGSVPNYQTVVPAEIGFNDLRKPEELETSPRKIISREYTDNGNGVEFEEEETAKIYPREENINRSSVTGLSRNDLNSYDVISDRIKLGRKNITSADGYTYQTPSPAYRPTYPYNTAYESESGHSLEFDDTPNFERITLTHRAGSYQEYYPSGTKIEEVVKNNYKIVMRDDHVYIQGKAIISVDSDALIKIKGDVVVEAENDLNVNVSGNMNLSVREQLNIKAKNINMESVESTTIYSGTASFFTSNQQTNLSAGSEFNATSGSATTLIGSVIGARSSSQVNLTGSSIEINGTLNTSGATNLRATGTDSRGDSHDLDVDGQGAADASATTATLGQVAGLSEPIERQEKNTTEPFTERVDQE